MCMCVYIEIKNIGRRFHDFSTKMAKESVLLVASRTVVRCSSISISN